MPIATLTHRLVRPSLSAYCRSGASALQQLAPRQLVQWPCHAARQHAWCTRIRTPMCEPAPHRQQSLVVVVVPAGQRHLHSRQTSSRLAPLPREVLEATLWEGPCTASAVQVTARLPHDPVTHWAPQVTTLNWCQEVELVPEQELVPGLGLVLG